MKQRGRKSAASLSVFPILNAPAPPPPELSEEGAQLWTDIVRSRGEFPPPTDTLLVAYIHHVIAGRMLSARIRALGDNADLKELAPLLAMCARETSSMARMASKLKLLPPRQRPPQGPRPWEIGQER